MRKFGLIGFPLEHSFSKSYFEKKFIKLQIEDVNYENYELDNINHLHNLIEKEPGINGLNVTIPHKENIIKFLHEVDDEVKKIGSVNVIKFQNGKLKGFNTDHLGFKESLLKWIPNRNFSALILGSGGSSNAIRYCLKKLKIPFKIVSRNSGESKITYNELRKSRALSDYNLIINSTPLGMYPHIQTFPDLDYELLTDKHYVFDLVYNPRETKLLSISKNKGAKTKNGYEMLAIQADLSWEIWNN
tara:strand:+ start:3064 stop:3798 length:735 start_codon:yes stop_codon:yes gene_type:complete